MDGWVRCGTNSTLPNCILPVESHLPATPGLACVPRRLRQPMGNASHARRHERRPLVHAHPHHAATPCRAAARTTRSGGTARLHATGGQTAPRPSACRLRLVRLGDGLFQVAAEVV